MCTTGIISLLTLGMFKFVNVSNLNFVWGHNWVHFALRLQCTFTMNSNFAILKTRNLLSITVKESFEPIILRKKKRRVFAFF